jgi:hypothetical protein
MRSAFEVCPTEDFPVLESLSGKTDDSAALPELAVTAMIDGENHQAKPKGFVGQRPATGDQPS